LLREKSASVAATF